MTPLTTCRGCSGQVYVKDVTTTLPARRAPHHIVLLYTCSYCMRDDRIAAERAEWTRLLEQNSPEELEYQATINAAILELEFVDDLGDLLPLWASYGPPMIEMPYAKACHCDYCERRRYTNVSGLS